MKIRLLTAEDYNALYNLWINTEGIGLNDKDDSREGIEKYLKRNPSTCFAADEDGKLVGAVLSGHDGRRGYISHTAVSSDYRKRGIGTALVNAVIDAMKAEGINKIALVVFAENEIGNNFWESKGFTVRNDLNYRNKAVAELNRIDT